MQLKREHLSANRDFRDPWTRIEHLVGAYVTGYVVLSVILWFGVWRVMPRHFIRLWVVGSGGEGILTAILLVTLRLLVRRHLWWPLHQQAAHDGLTGLYRPTVFWEHFGHQVALAYRHQQPLAFAFLDLDDFKQINDHYGHATGDAVLRAFGQYLRQQARAGDIVGRLGGEEFGWLLPGATVTDAQVAVERFLTLVRSDPIEQNPEITFSGGIAGLTGHETHPLSAWELAEAADRALYQVKAAGKAQIVMASSPST
ncbi:GGDEF domain-containing protein [Sulfobacillus harzensis]|uniref:GGDEF domain-containing protein n=1 Tax=Sulfobacillus harzensis TaxID=2729629 RepID=A0A7Y0L6L2_9FIRM|nr:GGDEF domain-containing protein [Sulfobacillus harzensis]NMP23983.1 GGDEF domain-containing protein [Sulfobacillus harzensis]